MSNKQNGWNKILTSVCVALFAQGVFGLAAIANPNSSTSEMPSADILRRDCTLNETDTTTDSGLPFDSHYLSSGNGQIVTVVLESDDFDAALTILHPDGSVVARNDDMSTYSGYYTLNAATAVHLWDKGIYTILTSTTGSTGVSTGRYSLLVSTSPRNTFTTQPEITAGCTGS